ncbi:MAG: hypothetical protein LW655_09855 [Limnohabitans sp.]|nr:hypothetical protein [Limnohabitans sp.]
MNMIDNALGVHAQALGLRSKRMEVLARNIANASSKPSLVRWQPTTKPP